MFPREQKNSDQMSAGESSHTASLSWGGMYSLCLLAQTQLVTSFRPVPRNVTAASTVKDTGI